jgi:ribosome recycling factor
MVKQVLKEASEKMTKAVDVVRHELVTIRTGRATPALIEGVKVDYYGNPTPLKQVANIGTPEPTLLTVQPWEKSMIQPIEKAIQNANLGLNPANDGTMIRVPIPPLNEERRKEYVKLTRKYGEQGKVSVRNVRREANDALKKLEKSKEISEDELKRGEDEVQKLTDSFSKEIDALLEQKEKDIMEV